MTRPARRRVSAEEIAVPVVDLVDELVEGIGEAGARLLPIQPVSAGPAPGQEPARRSRERKTAPQPDDRRPAVLLFPRIDIEVPLGPSPDNPMGEGSEETALPVIDPVDVRLGEPRNPPDPLP